MKNKLCIILLALLFTASVNYASNEDVEEFKIIVTADATIPSERQRTEFGAGETATLTISPPADDVVFEIISGVGTIEGNSFNAGETSGITAIGAAFRVNNNQEEANIEVATLLPTSITGKRDNVIGHGEVGDPNEPGNAGMEIIMTFKPAKVSFAGLEFIEVPGKADRVEGYFKGVPAREIEHKPNPDFVSIDKNNQFHVDTAALFGVEGEYSDGSFEWDITYRFRVVNKQQEKDLFNMKQEFEIDVNGKITIKKFGVSVDSTEKITKKIR